MSKKMISDNKTRERMLLFLLFIVVSVIYLLIFSLSTSFLYQDSYIGGDSNIFMLMGKLTKEGMIPYKEFFDHKGPFIFFIEYLGQMISEGRTGIFLIQIVFFTASLCGIYKILRLYCEKRRSLILTLASLLLINIYYGEGNYTEEYCLPFLMWSFYFAIKYLKISDEKQSEHKPGYAFLYGITFMVCALTRITNALPLCMIVLVGFVVLIKNKQWICIVKNIAFFILGSVLVLLPFIIYYVKVDALYEMFFGTILYNISYAGNDEIVLGVKDKINQIALVVPLVSVFIIGLCNMIWDRRKKTMGTTIVVSSAVGIIFQLMSYPYQHYVLIWIPLMVLGVGILHKGADNKKYKIIILGAVSICLFVTAGKVFTSGKEIYDLSNSENAKIYRQEADEIVGNIPENERNQVIAYNVLSYFYLCTDIKPCYKYCILQDWQCGKSRDMCEEFKSDIESLEAKYIVVEKNRNNNLDYIIEESYQEIYATTQLSLLKKCNNK